MHYIEPNQTKDVLGNLIIDSFEGEFAFLSNFYVREIVFQGVTFHSSEQAYMWSKTEDEQEKIAILKCGTPGQVKRFASNPKNVTLRAGWSIDGPEDINSRCGLRMQFMLAILEEKFNQNPDLAARLVATGESLLIEGNWWHDNFWGDCMCTLREKCKTPGDNHLGKLLMLIRSRLRADK